MVALLSLYLLVLLLVHEVSIRIRGLVMSMLPRYRWAMVLLTAGELLADVS